MIEIQFLLERKQYPRFRHYETQNLLPYFSMSDIQECHKEYVWGIERSGFFNGREKWAKGFENQRV